MPYGFMVLVAGIALVAYFDFATEASGLPKPWFLAFTSKCCSVSEPSRQTSNRWRLKMRKIRIIEQISLDGVIQAPGGPDEDGDYTHGGWAMRISIRP